eukprot:3195416-Amphidinium_carterae.2
MRGTTRFMYHVSVNAAQESHPDQPLERILLAKQRALCMGPRKIACRDWTKEEQIHLSTRLYMKQGWTGLSCPNGSGLFSVVSLRRTWLLCQTGSLQLRREWQKGR